MYTYYYKNIKNEKLKVRTTLKPGCWINMVNPTQNEINKISNRLKLDASWLTDALDPFEAPRIEQEDGTLYIFMRCPIQRKDGIFTVPLLICLTKEVVVTFSKHKIPALDRFIDEKINFFTTQKIKLLLLFIFEIYNAYQKFLIDITKKIKQNRINLERISNRDIVQLIQFEETVNEFLTDLTPIEMMLTNLLSGTVLPLYEDDRDLVEDLLLKNNELINLSRAKQKSLVNIRSAYSTIMSNNLNRVMRMLTGLTVILMVPSIITGLYGMNVAIPYAESSLAFIGILLGTLLISGILITLFIRNRWF